MKRLFITLFLLFAAMAMAAQTNTATCDKCPRTKYSECTKTTESGTVTYSLYVALCEPVPADGETVGQSGCSVNINWYGCDDGRGYNDTCEFTGGACMTYQPPPDDDPVPQQCGYYCCDYSCGTPLVFNAHAAYKFSAPDVLFDLNADGVRELTAWPMPGTLLLVLDQNGNGKIDDGRELFGNGTFKGVLNGWIALAAYDLDDNFQVNEDDQIFPDLQWWNDLNHDAVTDPGELSSVADSGVIALGLDYTYTGRRDPNGNALLTKGVVWMNDYRRVPYYDAYFRIASQ